MQTRRPASDPVLQTLPKTAMQIRMSQSEIVEKILVISLENTKLETENRMLKERVAFLEKLALEREKPAPFRSTDE